MKSSMEVLKTVKVDNEKMSVMNNLLSDKINEVLANQSQSEYLEGIIYVGSNHFRPEVELTFIWNDANIEPVKFSAEEQQQIRFATGMDIRIENIPEWYYRLEERFQDRIVSPREFNARNGIILYDRNNRTKELQADLQNDSSLDEIASYWTSEVCLFNPPVQYIRK